MAPSIAPELVVVLLLKLLLIYQTHWLPGISQPDWTALRAALAGTRQVCRHAPLTLSPTPDSVMLSRASCTAITPLYTQVLPGCPIRGGCCSCGSWGCFSRCPTFQAQTDRGRLLPITLRVTCLRPGFLAGAEGPSTAHPLLSVRAAIVYKETHQLRSYTLMLIYLYFAKTTPGAIVLLFKAGQRV